MRLKGLLFPQTFLKKKKFNKGFVHKSDNSTVYHLNPMKLSLSIESICSVAEHMLLFCIVVLCDVFLQDKKKSGRSFDFVPNFPCL